MKPHRQGYSLIEMVVVIGLLSFVAYLSTYFLESITDRTKKTENRSRAHLAIANFEKITNRLVASVSTATFDPSSSFLLLSTGTFQGVGELWNFSTPLLSPSSPQASLPNAKIVPAVHLGAFHRPRSTYDLDAYKVRSSADATTISTDTQIIYLSRCVPIEGGPIRGAVHRYQTLQEIDALSRPVLMGANQVQCCQITYPAAAGSAPFNDCMSLDRAWPTVFVYQGENSVDVIPADSDRDVVPGIGFALAFDANPAGYFQLATFTLENSCATGKIPNVRFRDCLKTLLGSTSTSLFQQNFKRDVVTRVSLRSGATVSSVAGGSFIMLGPSSIEKSENPSP